MRASLHLEALFELVLKKVWLSAQTFLQVINVLIHLNGVYWIPIVHPCCSQIL